MYYSIAKLIVVLIVLYILYLLYKKYRNESFDQTAPQAKSGSQNEIILYYANWCSFSRQFLPVWEKFEAYGKANLPNLRISRVLCEDGNETVCKQKGVLGYPSVILYTATGEIPYNSADRTLNALIEFVKNK